MCVQNSQPRPSLTCIPMMKQEADKEVALGGPSSDKTSVQGENQVLSFTVGSSYHSSYDPCVTVPSALRLCIGYM